VADLAKQVPFPAARAQLRPKHAPPRAVSGADHHVIDEYEWPVEPRRTDRWGPA